jgi:hypothetical protein
VRESLVNNVPLILGGGDKLGVAITGVAVSASVAIAAAVGGCIAGRRRIDRQAAPCGVRGLLSWSDGLSNSVRGACAFGIDTNVCVTDC